jgi:HlyD family secretion protein
VNQADVPRLKPNQTVEVTVEAVAGLHIAGTVERIAPQATIKNNLKGFAARIVLTNVDPRVRPGMTANVKIPVASAENVTAVPLSAVFTEKNPDTSVMERFVFVQQGDNFEKRNVKVGVSDFFYAEIQEGLAEGDVVATEMPKEELEKKTHQLAAKKPARGENGALRSALLGPAVATNTIPATAGGGSEPAPKAKSSSPSKSTTGSSGGDGSGGNTR